MLGPVNVQPDAQFTIAQVLRPFANFEERYQGENPHIPIAFFPEDHNHVVQALDPSAGDNGYDERLLRFTPVPFGSRICVWIPYAVGWDATNNVMTAQQYHYVFQWRIRNLDTTHRAVYGEGELAPHHMKSLWGRLDRTQAAGAQERRAIPSGTRTVIMGQAEVAGNLPQVQNLRSERINNITDNTRQQLPYLPNGQVGYYQQGILDPNEFTTAPVPGDETAWRSSYRTFWFDCEGDELMITALRDDAFTVGGAWNFNAGGADLAFSSVYGRNNAGKNQDPNRALGILLFTGSNP